MEPTIARALEPVMHDLECSFVTILDAEPMPDSAPPAVVLRGWEGTVHRFALELEASAAQRVVDVADHVQDLVADLLHGAGLPAEWPPCPEHPDSHPLSARALTEGPAWVCPQDAAVRTGIGSMPMELQRIGFGREPTVPRPVRPEHDQPLEPVIATALAPALHDLRAAGGPEAVVSDDRWGLPDLQATATVWSPAGPTSGVTVRLDGSAAEQVVEAADGLQEWVIDVLWDARLPTNWPPCPAHPTTHPLRPELQEQEPMWTCPLDPTIRIPIGRLAVT